MIDQVRIVIESVTPQVDGGRFAVKAVVGDTVETTAREYDWSTAQQVGASAVTS